MSQHVAIRPRSSFSWLMLVVIAVVVFVAIAAAAGLSAFWIETIAAGALCVGIGIPALRKKEREN